LGFDPGQHVPELKFLILFYLSLDVTLQTFPNANGVGITSSWKNLILGNTFVLLLSALVIDIGSPSLSVAQNATIKSPMKPTIAVVAGRMSRGVPVSALCPELMKESDRGLTATITSGGFTFGTKKSVLLQKKQGLRLVLPTIVAPEQPERGKLSITGKNDNCSVVIASNGKELFELATSSMQYQPLVDTSKGRTWFTVRWNGQIPTEELLEKYEAEMLKAGVANGESTISFEPGEQPITMQKKVAGKSKRY
jgi:hypothetical protein